MSTVFLNGQFLPREEACVPVDDRGFLFGDGIFTSLRLHEGYLECYQAHLDRLERHAAALNIEAPGIDFAWIHELAHSNDALKGSWRMKIIVTGGATELRRMLPRKHGHLLMTLEKALPRPVNPYRLTTYPTAIAGPMAHLKSLSYLIRLCIADYAAQQNCDDALVLSPEGWMLETSFANLFWRVNNKMYTPDPELPLLAGVSVDAVSKCVGILGMSWSPVKILPHELPSEAQLYLTNAMIGIMPVETFMDRQFGRDLHFEKQLRLIYEGQIAQDSVRL